MSRVIKLKSSLPKSFFRWVNRHLISVESCWLFSREKKKHCVSKVTNVVQILLLLSHNIFMQNYYCINAQRQDKTANYVKSFIPQNNDLIAVRMEVTNIPSWLMKKGPKMKRGKNERKSDRNCKHLHVCLRWGRVFSICFNSHLTLLKPKRKPFWSVGHILQFVETRKLSPHRWLKREGLAAGKGLWTKRNETTLE